MHLSQIPISLVLFILFSPGLAKELMALGLSLDEKNRLQWSSSHYLARFHQVTIYEKREYSSFKTCFGTQHPVFEHFFLLHSKLHLLRPSLIYEHCENVLHSKICE